MEASSQPLAGGARRAGALFVRTEPRPDASYRSVGSTELVIERGARSWAHLRVVAGARAAGESLVGALAGAFLCAAGVAAELLGARMDAPAVVLVGLLGVLAGPCVVVAMAPSPASARVSFDEARPERTLRAHAGGLVTEDGDATVRVPAEDLVRLRVDVDRGRYAIVADRRSEPRVVSLMDALSASEARRLHEMLRVHLGWAPEARRVGEPANEPADAAGGVGAPRMERG